LATNNLRCQRARKIAFSERKSSVKGNPPAIFFTTSARCGATSTAGFAFPDFKRDVSPPPRAGIFAAGLKLKEQA